MNTHVRELQVTPMPHTADVAEEPGIRDAGDGSPATPSSTFAFLRGVFTRLVPWLLPVGLIAFWQIAS